MGVYLGFIIGHYFKPLAEVKNSELKILTDADRKILLPASDSGNIWLYYWGDKKSKLEYWLQDKVLAILEFETKNLEPTYANRKKGTQIGYKIDLLKFVRTKEIRPIQKENIFLVSADVKSVTNDKVYKLFDGDEFIAKVFIPNKEDIDSMTKNEYEAQIARLQKEVERLTKEMNDASEKFDKYKKISDLNGEIYHLNRTIEEIKAQCEKFERGRREAEAQFDNIFRNAKNRIADIAFSGVMANKLLDAAANFDAKDLDEQDKALAEKIAAVKPAEKSPDELKDYLCRIIGIARPSYSEEDILNIVISLTQNFLTVFYGEPGCGKTSICNLFAEILGLNKIAAAVDDPRAGRYIPISVEKGWTSKRDFVGYYNPLSKTFDKSNRRIYDALRLLSAENKNSSLPFVVLLDEANLSPMEYYWSDFMNLCDELDENSSVNLGSDYIFRVPETLRFVATINNDHTTEELSPRLIDRACIITLPDFDVKTLPAAAKIPAGEVEIISWQNLRDAFNPPNPDFKNFPADAYGVLVSKMKTAGFSVSPRVQLAIQKYFVVAEKFFGKVLAFDYAVAQKILPKIQGSDDNFKTWLLDFQKTCAAYKLARSEKILQRIIERGEKNLGYYRFFA